MEYSGVYNSVNRYNALVTQRSENATLYCQYLGTTSNFFCQGSYGGLPSIVSTECTRFGHFVGKDGGRVCVGCKDLRIARGSANPSASIDKWGKTISRCLERREKNVLSLSDFDDAGKFIKIPENNFGSAGFALK